MATNVSGIKSKTGITAYLNNDAVKQNIVSVIGEKKAPTFISSIVSAVQTNPQLKECTNASILSAALLGESLDLTPSPQLGQYYLVPFNTKKTITDPETGRKTKIDVKEAQFQIGAKGYKQLAIRSGQYKRIVTSVIKEGELKSYNPITETFEFSPIMDMKLRADLPVIGYYAMFELNNGFTKELYWSKEQMENHAETYSQGYRSDIRNGTAYTFWSKDFDGMAEKTMIRQLISKWGIMSIQMQKAFERDMGVIRDNGCVDYVDNHQDAEEAAAEDIGFFANSEEFADILRDVETNEA